MKKLFFFVIAFMVIQSSYAQNIIEGFVYDYDTHLPLEGATVTSEKNTSTTNYLGAFKLTVLNKIISISFVGYNTQEFDINKSSVTIFLQKKFNQLDQIVVSANRDIVRRTQTPVSIATIQPKTIHETKATTIDQLLNKVSGVYMVNLGNEQHSMGIRQPIGTRSLFLYLEDGIPVRTTGVFNHNALMEMNMSAVQNIEVIKGPGSSLYGGEAIGGVINMITIAPSAIPSLKLSAQLNDIGYKRLDLQSGFTTGKLGVSVNGYVASRKNGFIEYNDFNKEIITARIDYRFSEKTKWENSFTTMNYFNQMAGSVDSAMFANKSFSSPQTFTYRKAKTTRFRSSLFHEWNKSNKTNIQAVYRYNSLGQNPSYRVRDDYRRVGATFIGKKDLAHGEINDNSFNSVVIMAQHRKKFSWLNASLIAGVSADFSPNTSIANYIQIKKDTITKKYVSYADRPDSLLVHYKTNISNYASYVNFEFSPINNLRVVAAVRFDAFKYNFNNYLPTNSVSGANDTVSIFNRWSPKIGVTYNFKKNRGIYVNVSQGFVPPQVSELFRSVKVPNLSPSVYNNYEIGGWYEFIKNKLFVDFSLYQLNGTNTIISVRFDDGTYGNANAGKTKHQGVELNVTSQLIKDVQCRIGGSYNKHTFIDYIERGTKYNGNEINSAPHWMHNAEIIYKPSFVKGLRIMAEWQKMTEYFTDQTNKNSYPGFDVINLRGGYQFKNVEVWCNVINLLNKYYALNSSSSTYGKSYTVAEPINFNVGISYNFKNLFK